MKLFYYNSKHKIIVGILIIFWAAYHFAGKRNTTAYYENGTPMYKGELKNGKNDGHWVWYYKNGKKKMEGNFKNGAREGLWYTYFPNGNISTECVYLNDQLNGNYLIRNENNETIKILTYKKDELVLK
ncbi:MAG: hypothetical protein P1U44_07270 [Vicingaceae bacterium]|jgi:antitoxin component YwqK of YwqJK toxin-antitoxin module|nr:hypothetical protein [Flavobacteriales bacterium]MDF1675505.1 hypothetical protein [Vicingaceae bacterium]|tara:strand:- start:302 stop:685 length:384 start_codon:yes stop_codon:yes gene_type:complete